MKQKHYQQQIDKCIQTLLQRAFTTHGCSDAQVKGGTAIYNHDARQREPFVFDVFFFFSTYGYLSYMNNGELIYVQPTM